eukprot:TRINITY_DN8638_c0_g1_i1.p1 TRINITY_DN8638_c0_g1~~TRINITY_DN8638_c0_g1_i1.p1  ORF type:complete len:335 (-),score=56.84 TRINITY_DN8638_c0_g1_i1:47-1051(-)
MFIFTQFLGLVVIIAVLWILESRAGMRGLKGEDRLPRWFHKGIRLLFLIVIFGPICVAFPLGWIPLLTYAYYACDLSELYGGRKPVLRNIGIWKRLARVFQAQLIKTVSLDPKRKYIFAVHPHGILPMGGILNLSTNASNFADTFPGLDLRGVAASLCFFLPLYRDFLLALGVCDAARYSAQRILDQGKSLYLVPGGATEALYASGDEDVLYLRNRTGFIRLAIQNGASLVPVFTFNESCAYEQYGTKSKWAMRLKQRFQSLTGISLPFIKHLLPKRIPAITVVGAPLHTTQCDAPSADVVQQVLSEYIAQLEALYAQHADKYNIAQGKKLRII